ncbi:MAG: hypothetical protein SGBAC_011044 [Bacillariaceae sp.]
MTDIYLSYDHPNSAFAEHLKHDVELFTDLSVGLDCDNDWEDANDCQFQEHLHQAKTLLILATQHSCITAWVMDDGSSKNVIGNTKDQSICFPATVDFSLNYQHGVNVFLNIVAKQRKINQRRRKREEPKQEEEKEEAEEECSACSRIHETRHRQEETKEEEDCSRIASAGEPEKVMANSMPWIDEDKNAREYLDDQTKVFDGLLQRLRSLELKTEQRKT